MARPGVAEALAAIEAALFPLGDDLVAIGDALGRLTAAPVHAALDVPRFAAAAMDGYAVASARTGEGAVRLPLAARGAAGAWPDPLGHGAAAPITTGAPMPAGADAVVIRENARVTGQGGDRVLCLDAPVAPGHNVRATGEDMARGAQVLAAGRLITPDAIGALAACGVERLRVRRRPRITFVTTGDELARSGAELAGAAQIVDSNGPMIAAACRNLGLEVDRGDRVIDDRAAVDAALDRMIGAASGDILISSGGVSVGAFDFVADRLARRGVAIVFHGVRMRPGKPLLFAMLPDGRPYFGLPGNPVAALVAFRFFVMAAIRRLSGLPPERGTAVDIAIPPREGVTLFLRGIMAAGKARPVVDVSLDQRSHVLSSVLAADCWLRLERQCEPLAFAKHGTLAP
jgi:molybdopterin molybdotransferase